MRHTEACVGHKMHSLNWQFRRRMLKCTCGATEEAKRVAANVSSEGMERKMRSHAHNACFGGIRHAITWMNNVQQRDSVTLEGRRLAGDINVLLMRLNQELKTRVDL